MLNNFKLVDLTQTITTSSPSWQGTASFSFTIIRDYHQGYRTQQFHISSNTGTHIEASGHFQKGAKMVATIPLSHLIVSACILDVRSKVSDDYRISRDDIASFEKDHGEIPADSLFIAHTGWCTRWNEPRNYSNLDDNGVMHFPGFTLEAAELLVKRRVAGVAIDTFSPDGGGNTTFDVHKLLLKNDVYIIENITNADQLPPTGAFVAALPIKIYDAVEAPLRIVGFIPH